MHAITTKKNPAISFKKHCSVLNGAAFLKPASLSRLNLKIRRADFRSVVILNQ